MSKVFRDTKPGTHRARACPPCSGDCQQGRACPAAVPGARGWPLLGIVLLPWIVIGLAGLTLRGCA